MGGLEVWTGLRGEKSGLDFWLGTCQSLRAMRFKNTTRVPETLLREVIRFVCPSSVTNYSIWFKRAGGGKGVFFAGTAYRFRRHVVCRIPVYHKLAKPYTGAGSFTTGRGYIPWVAKTYEESLVALVAHEMRHLAQHLNPTLYKRTPYARGQYSEVDCDTYANKMILAWRAEKGEATHAPSLKKRDPSIPKPLTPRQRLRAMADSCGCELDFGSPSPDCIWVGPPTPLCDEHGEMPNDPYEGEGHTCFSYHEAKARIETYAGLVNQITSPLPTICLESPIQPATVLA